MAFCHQRQAGGDAGLGVTFDVDHVHSCGSKLFEGLVASGAGMAQDVEGSLKLRSWLVGVFSPSKSEIIPVCQPASSTPKKLMP
jgi:hypothetical protein